MNSATMRAGMTFSFIGLLMVVFIGWMLFREPSKKQTTRPKNISKSVDRNIAALSIYFHGYEKGVRAVVESRSSEPRTENINWKNTKGWITYK